MTETRELQKNWRKVQKHERGEELAYAGTEGNGKDC